MVDHEHISLKIKKKRGCQFLYNIILEVVASSIWQENEIEVIKIGQGRRKTVIIHRRYD